MHRTVAQVNAMHRVAVMVAVAEGCLAGDMSPCTMSKNSTVNSTMAEMVLIALAVEAEGLSVWYCEQYREQPHSPQIQSEIGIEEMLKRST